MPNVSYTQPLAVMLRKLDEFNNLMQEMTNKIILILIFLFS
ncbi:hypothetical protein IQ02_02901, partial [Flavobacterium glaciei]